MCLLCVCVLLCFCTVHSIVCLMFMMWLPYGVINYNNRLIGKRVVNFLLLLIEVFSLGVTGEALRENIG